MQRRTTRRLERWFLFSLGGGALLTVLASPGGCAVQFGRSIDLSFDFRETTHGWEAGVADYGEEQEELLMFESGRRDVPDELGYDGRAFYIQGVNRSDDLFLYLKRKLGRDEGILPGRTYRVSFDILVASNAPTGCAGVGGAPGEGVYLKVGASAIEPHTVFDVESELFVMNVDKGDQSQGGPAASVVSDIANGVPCELIPNLEEAPYVLLFRSHTHDVDVTASDAGELWLLVGTDSAYESLTALYYQAINVSVTPILSGGAAGDGESGGAG
ncbi:MAG: hypothetical protein HY763_02915 [Planctomycetes bacterium]|nr:hypothetical protein [Planctomycetota bacterium]